MLKRIIERYYNLFDCEIQIRIEPNQFKKDLKNISNLINDRKFKEAKIAIEKAYSTWGSDKEIIRLDWHREFLEEDEL